MSVPGIVSTVVFISLVSSIPPMVFMISVPVLVASLVIVMIVPPTASTSPTSVSSIPRSVFGKPGVNYRRLTNPSLFHLTLKVYVLKVNMC